MDTKIGALDVCKPLSNEVGSLPNGTAMAIQNSAPSTVINSSEATLGRHLARRLVQIGVTDVFTVPGDFNLTLLDHLIAEPGLTNIGCCNELNAGYAADGYARSRGVGACVVTFTVGGLSVLNAIAGAYSENLPLICIVGGPNSNDYGTNRILHHTIGLPDFTQELRCFQTVTCYQAVVNNLEDAHESIDTAISTALKESKPVYISISCNLAGIPHPTFSREPVPFSLSPKLSNQWGLEAAVEAAAEFLNKAVKPVMVGGPKLRVAHAGDAFVELADASGYALAVMPSAKGLVPEHHPHFIGTYWGAVSTAFCAEIVESADAYLFAGPIFNDYSSVGYSLLLKKEKAIIVQPDRVTIANGPSFGCVLMKDFLRALAKKLNHNNTAHENYRRIFVPDGHPLKCAPREPLRVNVLFQHVQKKHGIGVRFSTTHKTSIACSLFLMATHFVVLLLLLNGSVSYCNHKVRAYLSESMQVISWTISSVAVYWIVNIKSIKFPWLLRAWWLCSFFLSIISVAVDTHLRITYHGELRLQDYAGFLSLLASICLFGISIRGKTGLTFIVPNGITEPLLNGKGDKHSEGKKESLYGKATLLQLITFSWLNPLFAVGIKKPLEPDEIPDVDIKDSAEFLSHSFDERLKYVKERDGIINPTIYKTIILFIWKKATINAIFAVISAGASYVGPYLIDDFVKFLNEKNTRSLQSGYILALAFLGAKMVEMITQRQWIFRARMLGLHLRAALISQIYKKGLVLSSQSRQSHTSGEVINYMSVDIQRITDLLWYLNIIWMMPVQLSLAIYILHTNLGMGSVATLAATFAVLLCNIPMTTIQKGYQTRIMEAKDTRMKATSEVLRSMKTIKLQAWDTQFLHKLESLRKIEYDWLWKSLRLSAIGAFVFWGSPTFISVVTFGACMFMGIELTAGRVLSALATFRMLQDPLFNLPDLLSAIAQGKVSADRVASYLQEDEIQQDSIEHVPKDQMEFAIEIENGRFSWDTLSRGITLDSIQLKVKRGMKVAICGTVGSGKSSLLSSILGEIQKVSGTVKISGTKAYVPQSPWILTGNIRENILFGNAYDRARYDRTIKACALEKDFELFSCGDLTEIGERGINMSGGQKQRIQIARAVYQDADIYLLDDPFSAVDAHTGTQLFEDCMMGILREKTILYVTHQVEFLPAADYILVLKDGKIAQAGRFEEILRQNIGFELLVGAHSRALESILTVENTNATSQGPTPDGESNIESTSNAELQQTRHESEHNLSLEITEKEGKLVQDEEREKGSIGKEVYWSYLTTVKGGVLIPIILLAQSSFQILQVASNYWMAWASPPTSESEPKLEMSSILLVYVLLAVGSSLCVLLRSSLVAVAGLSTAQKLFTNMLHSVLRAPMSFFDSTPTGRILNRASTDQSVLDLEMANKLGWCAFSIIQILGTIAVMSQVAWEVFVIFIPVTAVCIWYQQYYIPTARELARLSGIERAPILHHFAESLAGAATIRAFDQKERFSHTNLILIDNHSRPWFHNMSAMEWLSFRLNLLSNFVFAFSLVLLVTLPEGVINPSIAGLAVTYGINLNVLQASVIWNICNAENKMISVERILQYSNLTSEAPLLIEESRPPINWPEVGTICFKNLQIRYAEHLPSVLKNISCTFPGQKKVGVVGRTGSGKSTLIQAIFRVVEPREGSIIIDDVDICKIGLHDLRSRLSIIPQDPTMFEGTVRGNLDPLEQYSDSDVWEALNKCQLGDLVRAKEQKLDASVVENGENWSVGQRQLVCLGRALLKKSKILVLDEATASVDSATDGVIQKVISREFKDQTVVTIAHRIHTVIDSDLVLVLSDGRVAEYDTPAKLLEREESLFSKLIREYSIRSQSFNNLANLQS